MDALQACLDRLNTMHQHLCPKQVLGVRVAMLAAQWHRIKLPQSDKRMFAFVETEGCFADGVSVGSGCWLGHRTLRLEDYGKVAATFVDTQTGAAVRIHPHPRSRVIAQRYAPDAPDRWHAQLKAYQVMPDAELLVAQSVMLDMGLDELISRHGLRVVCVRCGEDIINEREVRSDDGVLCRACAGKAYYRVQHKAPDNQDMLVTKPGEAMDVVAVRMR
ncbi:MAG: TraR/DksA C4-type zinc finger protein [Chloroflexi bacterium]|nr:TraR/DksA C4-type zinc finger protein [Chloroflexota bacterium]